MNTKNEAQAPIVGELEEILMSAAAGPRFDGIPAVEMIKLPPGARWKILDSGKLGLELPIELDSAGMQMIRAMAKQDGTTIEAVMDRIWQRIKVSALVVGTSMN